MQARSSLLRLAAAGLIMLLPAAAGAIPAVSFEIPDSEIRIGEQFIVDIIVDGVDASDEVVAFGFDLGIDSSWTQALAPVIGPAFDYDDSSSFPDTDVAGSVDFSNSGPSGDGILLATLSFVGSEAGAFDLEIISDLLDANEGLFTLADVYDLSDTASVTILRQPTGETPAAPTLALLFAGLAGLRLARGRVCRREPAG